MYEEAKENTKWTPVGYFPNLGQAVSGAVRREVGLHPDSGLTNSIIAIDGIAARYYMYLGDRNIKLDDIRSARVNYEKAHEFRYQNKDILIRLIDVYSRIKEYDLSIQMADAVIAIDSEDTYAYHSRVDAYIKKNRKDWH